MNTSAARSLCITGRAWVLDDWINTDELYPGYAMKLPLEDAAQQMLHASRPGWPGLVQSGDVVVAGRGFGMGSSRPVAMLFKTLGVAAVVAEGFSSLFFRDCVNNGLPALTAPGVRTIVSEGDSIEVDLEAATVRNVSDHSAVAGSTLPDFVLDIVRAGGVLEMLRARGLILDAETTPLHVGTARTS